MKNIPKEMQCKTLVHYVLISFSDKNQKSIIKKIVYSFLEWINNVLVFSKLLNFVLFNSSDIQQYAQP